MDFKKTLLMACLFVGLNTFAQNRLEFNRIVSLSGSLAGGQIMQLDTVPQNKVWKIINFVSNYQIGPYARPVINNINVNVDPSFICPYWLKEGGVIGIWINPQYASSLELSIIEFNIITD